MYTADDFKTGDMVVVHLPSKKGRYLGEVRKGGSPPRKRRGIPKSGSEYTYGGVRGRVRPPLPPGGSMVASVAPSEEPPTMGSSGKTSTRPGCGISSNSRLRKGGRTRRTSPG